MIQKRDLINKIAEKTELPKRAIQSVLENLTDIIIEEVKKKNTVHLYGLLKITPRLRHARNGINPRTLEPARQPAMYVPQIRACSRLKQALKGIKVE